MFGKHQKRISGSVRELYCVSLCVYDAMCVSADVVGSVEAPLWH